LQLQQARENGGVFRTTPSRGTCPGEELRMNQKLTWVAIGTAFFGMAMTLPSCPGQQAMQQQIDGLTTHQRQLDQRIQGLDTQLKNEASDLTQVKSLLNQLSQTVLAQKDALEKMNATIQSQTDAITKLSAPKKPARRSTRSSGRRHR
jgi:septal ring factor EnvC (AmiA/AmiB activator)